MAEEHTSNPSSTVVDAAKMAEASWRVIAVALKLLPEHRLVSSSAQKDSITITGGDDFKIIVTHDEAKEGAAEGAAEATASVPRGWYPKDQHSKVEELITLARSDTQHMARNLGTTNLDEVFLALVLSKLEKKVFVQP